MNDKLETRAMELASRGEYIPKVYRHDPTKCDYLGNTVAMIYAMNGYEIPSHWEHGPEIMNRNGDTVAMLFAA